MDADRHTSTNMMLEQLNELSSPSNHNNRMMTPNTQTTQDTSSGLVLAGSHLLNSNRQPLIDGSNNNSNLKVSQNSNRRNPLVQSTKNSRQSQNSTNHFKGQATTLRQRRGSQD